MMMMVKKNWTYSYEILRTLPREFASASGTDKTFGLWDKDGKFYIGNKEAKIKENYIIVCDREYVGTPGLWELSSNNY